MKVNWFFAIGSMGFFLMAVQTFNYEYVSRWGQIFIYSMLGLILVTNSIKKEQTK